MTSLRLIRVLWVGACLFVPTHASGQQVPGLETGHRVRVTSPQILMWTAEGLVTENASGWLGLDTDAGHLRVRVESVTRVESSRGMRRRPVRGAVLGLLSGVAAGALIVGADTADGVIDPECGELHCFGYGFRTLLMGAGLAAGTLVGYVWRSEDWGDLPLPSPSIGLSTADTGAPVVRIGLSFKRR